MSRKGHLAKDIFQFAINLKPISIRRLCRLLQPAQRICRDFRTKFRHKGFMRQKHMRSGEKRRIDTV